MALQVEDLPWPIIPIHQILVQTRILWMPYFFHLFHFVSRELKAFRNWWGRVVRSRFPSIILRSTFFPGENYTTLNEKSKFWTKIHVNAGPCTVLWNVLTVLRSAMSKLPLTFELNKEKARRQAVALICILLHLWDAAGSNHTPFKQINHYVVFSSRIAHHIILSSWFGRIS